MRFVGMDGCAGGWLAVILDEEGAAEARVVPSLRSFAAECDDARVLIDIPIGLRDRGPMERLCDFMARKALGRRGSSVFPAPARGALAATDYASACLLNAAATGRRLSLQSWSLCGRIAEVDEYLRKRKRGPSVREMHPELCFFGLAGERPMAHPKRKEAGFQERLALLARHLPTAPLFVEQVERAYPRRLVAADDILDALVGAVTARHGGDALLTVPLTPEFDSRGLPMEMVYWRP
jgi:predicted RNase H-like nuclease